MIFLVMAPCGPLYFLEKHRRQPALRILSRGRSQRIVRGRPAGDFLEGSKAQLRIAQRAMTERKTAAAGHYPGRGQAAACVSRAPSGCEISYQWPVFGIDAHGSFGGSASPFCSSSIEMLSGERTNAMCPSRGGRLIVTPASMSFWHSA